LTSAHGPPKLYARSHGAQRAASNLQALAGDGLTEWLATSPHCSIQAPAFWPICS